MDSIHGRARAHFWVKAEDRLVGHFIGHSTDEVNLRSDRPCGSRSCFGNRLKDELGRASYICGLNYFERAFGVNKDLDIGKRRLASAIWSTVNL